MTPASSLHLFEGFGLELEYMIVDRRTLSVLPVADRLLQAMAGETVSEVEVGPLCCSNELALHVVELKTNGPVSSFAGLAAIFGDQIKRINRLLASFGGALMPTGMHPWMDPRRETRLWPHEGNEIYRSYDRIFGCRDHGWANLQSVHLNLPFTGDAEFARLHAAVRQLLPILPALAASSPVMEGRATGLLDNRLEVYRCNQRRYPSITGRVIPEPVYSSEAYRQTVLEPIYRQIAPADPLGRLRHEWLNSRGAIARFDRGTIEIRLLDVQECPQADLALIGLIVAVLKALVAETWTALAEQKGWQVDSLAAIMLSVIREGESAEIADPRYLHAFGLPRDRCRAGDLWRHLAEKLPPGDSLDGGEEERTLRTVLEQGSLARRLLRALGDSPSPARLRRVYRRLCACLAQGEMFLG